MLLHSFISDFISSAAYYLYPYVATSSSKFTLTDLLVKIKFKFDNT